MPGVRDRTLQTIFVVLGLLFVVAAAGMGWWWWVAAVWQSDPPTDPRYLVLPQYYAPMRAYLAVLCGMAAALFFVSSAILRRSSQA